MSVSQVMPVGLYFPVGSPEALICETLARASLAVSPDIPGCDVSWLRACSITSMIWSCFVCM